MATENEAYIICSCLASSLAFPRTRLAAVARAAAHGGFNAAILALNAQGFPPKVTSLIVSNLLGVVVLADFLDIFLDEQASPVARQRAGLTFLRLHGAIR